MQRVIVLPAVLVLAALALLGLGRAFPLSAQSATPEARPPGTCPRTTEAENEALVRRWYEEVWNGRRLDLVDALLADDYARSRAGVPFANEPGNADDVRFVEMVMTEFPDVRFTVEDVLADGDKVVVRTVTTGTHRGPLVDLGGAPATGRAMARENLAIWRVACGELAEQWIVQDNLGMLRQLGVVTDDELADAGTPTVATPAR